MEPKTMPIEPKDGARPADATAAAPDEPTFVRKLDHPYFELRTPDAQTNSYLEGNAQKMLTADQEKLHVFLAEARLVMDQSTTPRKRSVHYKIDAEKYKNIRPMDALPPSEFAAFEAAAKDFYDKAAPDRKDVHPYETFLRLNFRLPDPDKEPDAYLVYGEDFERRLLILWGCEKEKDSALPLAKHAVVRPRRPDDTVLDRLRRKIIGWEQMQKDTLLLLAKTREPLFRFLGQPVMDDKGTLKGVKIGEIALSTKELRPLRYLLPPEMKLFYKACQEFYARAVTAKSPYEKELRTNFQLPDPEKMPEAFRVHGPINHPRLVIVFDGSARREQTIWLTPVPEQNIPPMPPVTPEQELLGHKPVPPLTLTDKLQRRTIPFAKIFSVAGAIVATPLVIAFLVWLALDKSPPRPLKEIVPGSDATSILVRFNEPIDPVSVPKAATLIPKSFVLVESNGGPVTITSATLNTTGDYKNREIALASTTPFTDGNGYRLSVNGLADRALLHNQMRNAVQVGFIYADNKPPVLGMPSGDGESLSHLVLPFNKNMDATSIAETANYSIDGANYKVSAATLDEDKKSVILTVSPDMPLKSEHTLIVKNVKDASHLGNNLKPDPTSVDFRFVDTMPPKLRKVTAEEQNKVVLEFNEKLSPATVTNIANYSLASRKDGGKLDVYFAQLVDLKKIAIFTAPLFKDIDYDLGVTKIGDMADPINIMSTEERRSFTLPPDRENRFAPRIESLSHQPDRT
ncbi:MAG TPA: Ig-like domain-containing protein, partial [Verrucomicrobiae bacterium]|nr:Ig-like domain-containing protein [Verrucomicrobiae bacterium]